MTAETCANHDMSMLRMPVHNEVLVRTLRVKADATFSHRRLREPGDMGSHEVSNALNIVRIRIVINFGRVTMRRAAMKGDFETGTRM